MAVRTDVTIDWLSTPRLLTVLSPSVTITVQDLVDTLRDLERRFWLGMQFASPITATGKDDLGAGAFVGITSTLRNTLLAFAARPGPTYVQCSVTGGNLVATNAAGTVVTPISPTAFTQVVISQSTSPSIDASIKDDVKAAKQFALLGFVG